MEDDIELIDMVAGSIFPVLVTGYCCPIISFQRGGDGRPAQGSRSQPVEFIKMADPGNIVSIRKLGRTWYNIKTLNAIKLFKENSFRFIFISLYQENQKNKNNLFGKSR